MSTPTEPEKSTPDACAPPKTGTAKAAEAAAEAREAPPFVRLQAELASLATLPYHDARKQAIAAFEREYVRSLLEICKGNVSLCARTAGIDRVYLHRLLRRHGLRRAGSRKTGMKSERMSAMEGAHAQEPTGTDANRDPGIATAAVDETGLPASGLGTRVPA